MQQRSSGTACAKHAKGSGNIIIHIVTDQRSSTEDAQWVRRHNDPACEQAEVNASEFP